MMYLTMRCSLSTCALLLCLGTANPVSGQSSTLGHNPHRPHSIDHHYHRPHRDPHGMVRLDPGVAAHNPLAYQAASPRQFGAQDLVTIIIRESIETDVENELTTEVETEHEASVDSVPYLDRLLNTPLTLGLDSTQTFEGEGDKSNSNSVSTRITARVVEVLPNGQLVLEARKLLQLDSEVHEVLVSGICRPQDITRENTVLSHQIDRLTLRQITKGDLKKAATKGWITTIFDTIFGF